MPQATQRAQAKRSPAKHKITRRTKPHQNAKPDRKNKPEYQLATTKKRVRRHLSEQAAPSNAHSRETAARSEKPQRQPKAAPHTAARKSRPFHRTEKPHCKPHPIQSAKRPARKPASQLPIETHATTPLANDFQSFGLNDKLLKALEKCAYQTPTAIQARTIPVILDGRDVIASAETGTGKTAAFALPILHRLASQKSAPYPRVLILSPTRELANQIMAACTRYGSYLKTKVISLVGGESFYAQSRALAHKADIIVATPGRLLDHMRSHPELIPLTYVNQIVFDEADRMMDMGFIDDITTIVEAISPKRQTLLFSATIDKRMAAVIEQFLTDPVYINTKTAEQTPLAIEQSIYMADNLAHKKKMLSHLLENEAIFKGIIFSETKVGADQLAIELREKGFKAQPIHSDLRQQARARTLDRFKTGKIQFLVATDVMARGIHVDDISHVINFDIPRFHEDYVHRIGRTGRAGKTGQAISFALPHNQFMLQRIARDMQMTFSYKVIEGLEPTTNPRKKTPEKKNRWSAKRKKNREVGFNQPHSAPRRARR